MNFHVSVEAAILIQLKAAGVKPSDGMLFFDSLVRQMYTCKPNYGSHKNNGMRKYTYDTWLLRGYYPETSVFFRLTLSAVPSTFNNETHLVGRVVVPKYNAKRSKYHLQAEIGEEISNQVAEKFLLGSNTEITEYPVDKVSLPKCISPKGMPFFKPPLRKIT